MKNIWKKPLALAGFAGLLAVAGCADTGTSVSGDTALAELDLTGISIAVGSKDFDEQLILGYMLVEAFEAAGATVTDRVDLGGTNVAREALESGQIDTYMEYNGTGWTVHLGFEDPSANPDELTEAVRAGDLERNGIVWLGRSPFNNTYGFVSSPDLTEANGGPFSLQTMMEYTQVNPDTTVCMESEYPSRPDGLVLVETATGLTLPQSQQLILDTGIIYTETAANNCDFGLVFTTDGRIVGLGLTLVDDPGVHILYNASVNIREETYNQAPEAFDAIVEAILTPLDNERMAGLNERASLQGEDPRQVARDFLVEEGLL